MLISHSFINMITNRKYILASSSKSRYMILKNSGFKFKQVKPLCDEELIKEKIRNKKTKPTLIAKKLSYEKAQSISRLKKYKGINIIGCDTIIYIKDKVFDKAKNMEDAKIKIKKLSGKTHKINSSLTICRNGKKIWECSETSVVKIRKLNNNQIEKYLRTTGKVILNSVGCYQVESLGPTIIESVTGDFFNVMGLPLFKLLKYTYNNK